MADISRWAPYREKMSEQLNQLALKEIYQDLTAGKNLKVFTTDKLAKIAIGECFIGDTKHIGICTIFPLETYWLPLYISIWDEQEKQISMLVDIMPTVDSLNDEPFRIKYLDSMQPLWEKFANLPGIVPFEDDGVRRVCSIIYTAAVVPIEKEGMRLAALAPHTEYLKSYIEFVKGAPAADGETKIKEIRRKIEAVKSEYRSYLQRAYGGSFHEDMIKLFF
jgi:hypothetical protein